ncbi:MAG: hypothetical protein IT380_09805 [Myxococcales bacterium]|nr:hypothetical protein [Myxococcales bacterium]
MRRLLILLIAGLTALQLSCGGEDLPDEAPPPDLQALPPDFLSPQSTWPDAADLGVVVSSGVDPLAPRPPPPPMHDR